MEANSARRVRGGALPKARQWCEWLAYHGAALPADHGWIQQTRDTLLELHHAIVTAARRLRGNPCWDLQGTMTDDTERLAIRADALAQRAAALKRRPDIPARFQPLLDVLEGACRQHVRLAREIDAVRAGHALAIELTTDQFGRRLLETS